MSGVSEPLVPSRMGSEPLSNESMYLNWSDLERGITGVQRIAHQPNNEGIGRAEVWHAVMLRDGRRYRRAGTVPFDPEWRSHGRYTGEGLAFELFEDRAVISYEDLNCRSSLTFTPFHSPIDWSKADGDEKADHEGLMFSGHIEVGGAVQGAVWLDGERFEVRGMGYRDHSWGGVRDMRQFRTTQWANGTIGPACTFGVLWCSLGSGQCVEGGYVVRDGEMTKVAGIDMTVGMDVDSLTMRRARLTIRCADRSEVEVIYEGPFDGALFQSGDWITTDSPTAITVDGREGVGTVEVAMNARGGLEWPRVNGLCSVDGYGMRS
jgi:hypothetical protein